MEMATRRREQEVWQACDDLWALNGELKSLTGDAIRDRLVSLGKSRGSPNEIYKYRRTWGESRGLNDVARDNLVRDENDPITRAVRLVHEKLQQESKDEIESIQQQMQELLEAKDAQLAKQKEDLLLVMEEFSRAQQENTRLQKALAEQALELEAEVAVRKALERELAGEKKDHRQSLAAHSELLSETKSAHQEMITILKDMHAKEQTNLLELLEKSACEKKELGHKFSEQLNELKFNEHNLKLQISSYSQKLEEFKAQDALHKRELSEQKSQTQEALLALGSLKVLASNHGDKLAQLKRELEQEKHRFVKLSHQNKSRELTIGRLRAVLAHQERQWKR